MLEPKNDCLALVSPPLVACPCVALRIYIQGAVGSKARIDIGAIGSDLKFPSVAIGRIPGEPGIDGIESNSVDQLQRVAAATRTRPSVKLGEVSIDLATGRTKRVARVIVRCRADG